MTISKAATFLFLSCAAMATVLWGSACQSACHGDSDHGCGHGGDDVGAGGGSGGGGGMATLAERYCDCMLVSCHDSYHTAFGPESDEDAARANCLAEAESLPVAGEEVTEGNFIECRIHHCELGKTDESACPSSIGEGVCTDGAGGSSGSAGG